MTLRLRSMYLMNMGDKNNLGKLYFSALMLMGVVSGSVQTQQPQQMPQSQPMQQMQTIQQTPQLQQQQMQVQQPISQPLQQQAQPSSGSVIGSIFKDAAKMALMEKIRSEAYGPGYVPFQSGMRPPGYPVGMLIPPPPPPPPLQTFIAPPQNTVSFVNQTPVPLIQRQPMLTPPPLPQITSPYVNPNLFAPPPSHLLNPLLPKIITTHHNNYGFYPQPSPIYPNPTMSYNMPIYNFDGLRNRHFPDYSLGLGI